MKYIDNNPQRGIDYNWGQIRKEMKKLSIPTEYYNPITAPLDSDQWFVELSERATGKTTGWLLLGMVMYQLYGTVTMYLRSRKDMIAPKNSSSLFNVIIENGYIEKITGGKYNNVWYRSRKWYFCKIDEDSGEIIEKAETYFCRMVSIDESTNLKSSLNEPTGDLVIFDEFISVDRYQQAGEFVFLVDVISTIFRLRECGKIVMLANTIDKYNQYFHDLEIFERISTMDISDNCTHVTDRGTRIYIEFIGAPKAYRIKKSRWVRLFAGFKKPELASITGEALWSVRNYQHIPEIPEDVELKTLYTNIYLYHNSKLVRFDIVNHSELGICIFAHWATQTYDDSIIITRNERYDNRYIHGFPTDRTVTKFLRKMITSNRVYYSANDVGSFVQGYLNLCGFMVK